MDWNAVAALAAVASAVLALVVTIVNFIQRREDIREREEDRREDQQQRELLRLARQRGLIEALRTEVRIVRYRAADIHFRLQQEHDVHPVTFDLPVWHQSQIEIGVIDAEYGTRVAVELTTVEEATRIAEQPFAELIEASPETLEISRTQLRTAMSEIDRVTKGASEAIDKALAWIIQSRASLTPPDIPIAQRDEPSTRQR